MGGGWEWPRGWEEGKGMGQLETKKVGRGVAQAGALWGRRRMFFF